MTAKLAPEQSAEVDKSDFTPLTAQQVQEIRRINPSISPWRVVFWQLATGLFVALSGGLVMGSELVAISVGCGALSVALPAALFARGVTSQFAKANAGTAVASFFLWEFVKVSATVALMFGAHRFVDGLSWPAMLVGLVVTIKVYWVALGFKPKAKTVQENNA